MKSLKKYLITFLIGCVGVFLILWYKDIFSQTEPVKIFHILTDAFFVVGVVVTSAGLLVFSSNEGTFDMLVYGVRSFMDFFRKEKRNKFDTFYDYRQSRAETKLPFGFIVINGLFFLAVSFVMLFLYHQYG